MPAAEFEEREFETPLYNQLQQTSWVWSPGQVLEGHIGFDYAALCQDSRIWDVHGIEQPFAGVLLEDLPIYLHLRRRRRPRQLPNFELNLFLQAKRPDHLKYVRKNIKSKGLSGPYWRINLELGQQAVLEALASQINGTGLVCYAAPAFHRLSQLYSHIRFGTMVESSTFPEALSLTGHVSWNYQCPGNVGVANIEPKLIDGEALLERLARLASERSDQNDEALAENLRSLAMTVNSCADQQFSAQESRSALFFQHVSSIAASLDGISGRSSEVVQNFLTVQAFCSTFGLKWFTVGSKRYA